MRKQIFRQIIVFTIISCFCFLCPSSVGKAEEPQELPALNTIDGKPIYWLRTEGESGLYPRYKNELACPYVMENTLSPFSAPFISEPNGEKYTSPYILREGVFARFEGVYKNEDNQYRLLSDEFGIVFDCDEFMEDNDHAKKALSDDEYINKSIDKFYDQVADLVPFLGELREEEYIELDGHLVRLAIWYYNPEEYKDKEIKWDLCGFVISGITYARNNQIMVLLFITSINDSSWNLYSSPWEDIPRYTMDDLRKVAGLIAYDKTKADCMESDGELTLKTKNDQLVIVAGKKIQLVTEYSNPQKANAKIKSASKSQLIKEKGPIEWIVLNSKTGEMVPEITIDNKGFLLVDKALNEVINIDIKAESRIFHTQASLSMTIIPAASAVSVDKNEVFFYLGDNTSEKVRIIIEPETVPPIGITWTAQKKGVVEIVDNNDGTATIKPVAGGKTVITVAEPGGKQTKLNVSVVAPVESVELTLSGKTIPGGKVNAKVTLLPKNAGNKKVEWSLNVDESIAKINEKGQVIISKEAPVGTKIIVTCKALGAPEPVEQTCEFEVVEK